MTDEDRNDEHDRRREEEQRSGTDDIEATLEHARGAGNSRRRKTDERQALNPVYRRVRAESLEEPGHDVHLHVALSQGEDEPQHLFGQVLRERDDHPVDGVTLHDVDDLVRLAKDWNALEVAAQLLRVRIDETDEVDPVLGMVKQLPPDQLPHIAGAEDERVLDIRRVPPRERARDESGSDHADQRQEPEGRQLGLIRP